MNYNQRFDEHIKDQFADYKPSVHPRIWENIANQRDKKRPLGFWVNFLNRRTVLFGAVFLLALGGATYFLFQKNNNANTNAQSTGNNVLVEQPEAELQKPVVANTKTAQQNSIEVVLANSKNLQDNSITPTTNNNAISYTEQNISNKDITVTNNTQLPVTAEPTVYFSLQKKKININNASLRVKYKNAIVTDEEREEINTYQLSPLFFVAEKVSENISAAALQKNNQKNVLLPDCPSIEKNTAGNKTYIEVYGGPDVAFRSFADTANSVYLQKRKESTKFSSAYSAGLRYTKVFNNGMSIRTGINYSQINEKFIYSEGNIIQVVYLINAAGDTIGSYTTTGTRFKTTHNKFRTIDVPVAIGYEMGNGRLHANINAGVIVNIYSWQRGEVLDYNLRPVNITTGKSNSPFQFKTNIGLGFIGAASLYYKMNDKLHFVAEPYFRYSLAPASKATTTFKQKYNTAGLRLGLRLDLQ